MRETEDHELDLATGPDVRIEHVDAVGPRTARFDVHHGDRTWRVDVGEDDVELVAAYEAGALADLGVPEWMEEVAAKIRHA